jgi:K+-transporting ATPase KdpF subunit
MSTVVIVSKRNTMELEYLFGGILSLLLAGYLIYALLRPERF